ncbi:TetR/AcrR family transcriptional regulator [Nocardioides sp. B-3]|uniref:TetR/AcrR family transcriptional regulator n=1 Tax=Nocardioides sp. B-3 TaxID=2895565 RepID=UPI002153405D|nr:TetR/AcrR family transcriptional regulator [Nocardioides sp. B-3]UUZ58588.1 TetR/AcrR family transcriptional regulator [Nocardioides sp. B-3]
MSAVPGRYAKGVVKRAEILDAALDVLESEGSGGASLRVIAKAADISPAGLMHYFPTRDMLFTELQRDLDLKAEQTYFRGLPHGDPGEVLAAALEGNAARPAIMELHMMLTIASMNREHPAADYLRERYARFADVISAHVEALQAAGRARSDIDPRYVAAALIAAADGIRSQWLHDRSVDMGDHVRRTRRVLLDPSVCGPR